MTDQLEDLRIFLACVSAGFLDKAQTKTVEELLSACWDDLAGGKETRMARWKLHGRTEEMEWNPPELRFHLERHGAAKSGSTRGEIQAWVVNIDSKTASVSDAGSRQIRPRDKPLEILPLANGIAQVIINKRDDQRISWSSDGAAKVRIGEVIPETYKATTAGRRKRLRMKLRELLEPLGWKEVSPNRFRKAD